MDGKKKSQCDAFFSPFICWAHPNISDKTKSNISYQVVHIHAKHSIDWMGQSDKLKKQESLKQAK